MVFTHLLSFHLILITFLFPFMNSNIFTSATTVTVGHESQAHALLDWKASLEKQSQASLSSWTSSSSPCMWEGIVCDDSKYVSTINVTNMGLKGTLLSFNFSSFPKLFTVDISNNSLDGKIPHQIGNLSRISQLRMDDNYFIGSIPTAILQLANLSSLNLTHNKLSGYIPQEIGELGNLKYLLVGTNQLSGSIPRTIGRLTNLVELDLSDNSLSGTIPSIRNLTNLQKLWIFNISLSGPIPDELEELYTLTTLTVSNIPYQWLEPSNLTQSFHQTH